MRMTITTIITVSRIDPSSSKANLLCLAVVFSAVLVLVPHPANAAVCAQAPSLTTVSGRAAKTGPLCPHELIFEENFDTLNPNTWKRISTFWGGGNNEFQWYTDSDRNSFVRGGNLVIKPTLTTDLSGFPNLEICEPITLSNCTMQCEHVCSADNIAPPVQSARLESIDGFAFKYGRVEIRAKLPTGDWLWPAIWLLPKANAYGIWPRSGHMNLMESRGNTNYVANGKQIGVYHVSSVMHYGPDASNDAWATTFMERNSDKALNLDFHLFQMMWAPTHVSFSIDNEWIGTIHTEDGFFRRGGFSGTNPWQAGELNAPYDQEFYFIMNLAVGGRNGYFPDVGNANGKAWRNIDPYAMRDFWRNRDQWLESWNFDPDAAESSAMLVDYIRVYAL